MVLNEREQRKPEMVGFLSMKLTAQIRLVFNTLASLLFKVKHF